MDSLTTASAAPKTGVAGPLAHGADLADRWQCGREGDPPLAKVTASEDDLLESCGSRSRNGPRESAEPVRFSGAGAGRSRTCYATGALLGALVSPALQTYRITADSASRLIDADGKVLGERPTVDGFIFHGSSWRDDAPALSAGASEPIRRWTTAVVSASAISWHLSADERDKTLVEVMLQVDKPPANMGFVLSLRAGGELWPLGPVDQRGVRSARGLSRRMFPRR